MGLRLPTSSPLTVEPVQLAPAGQVLRASIIAMRRYVFRLDDPTSRTFQGVVVIFATQTQEVWRKLANDDRAEHISHTVAHNEVAALTEELKGLVEGVIISVENPLLRQIFQDRAISGDHQGRFAGSHEFTMIARTESSLEGWVDRSYQEVVGAV